MKIYSAFLSFRYRKSFLINRFKLKKIEISSSKIINGSHNSCPICFSKEASLISEVDRVGILCNTVICKKCEFVFNNSFIANPIEFYANQFGQARWGEPEKNFVKRTSLDSFSWKRFLFLKKIMDKDFPQIEKILEIGCGDGCNLLHFHLIGKQVTGCDLATPFLEPGRKRGLNLIQGDITSISKNIDFDLIMLIHSFEHVVDLDLTVQSAFSRLREGGFIFVEVPGIIGWNQTRKKSSQTMGLKSSNNFLQYLQFEHNYHFSLEHLKLVWERNGFEMIYGDEWVRAIFRKKNDVNSINSKISFDNNSLNVMNHLQEVEKDFLKISNFLSRLVRLINRKLTFQNTKFF